jgi:hypothetical protein
MSRTHTDSITIGRNPVLTYNTVVAVHNRRVREAKAARRREKLLQICRNALDALRFWK